MTAIDTALRPAVPSRSGVDALRSGFMERRPFLLAALSCAIFFALVRFDPLQWHWRFAHQAGAIYFWWPAAVYGCFAAYVLRGVWRHRRTGEPALHPITATIAAVVLAVIPIDLLTQWSTDRGLAWRATTGLMAAAALVFLVLGWIAYSELWRVWFNDAVVTTMLRAIDAGNFRRYAKRGLHGRWWGSPHALIIVRCAYQIIKTRLRDAGNHHEVRRALQSAVIAGETLLAYLGWRWSGSLSHTWRMRRADVYRELAIMALWAADHYGVPLDQRRISRWMYKMARTVDAAYRPYVDFLRTVFALPVEPARMPGRARIQELLDGYRAIPDQPLAFGDRTYDARRIARDTWIAVASSRLPEPIVLDAWMVMHDGVGDPLDVDAIDEDDPADAWARQRVVELYTSWVKRVPREWRELLHARAGTAESSRSRTQRSETARAIIDRMLEETRRTSSWPYVYVWRTFAVQRCALITWIVPAALHATAMLAVVPGLYFHDVEAIRDLRPLHDYRDSTIHAMAATGTTLGLATSDGLLFVDKASRVVQPHGSRGAALDVTSGTGHEEMIVLGADQSVRGVTPAPFDLDRLWLPPPPHPVWRGETSIPPRVVRSQVDDDGWLVALQGRGIARYQLARNADGSVTRTRSWQQSPLSTIDLRDAIFTEKGAWLQTPERVDFADRRQLLPIASRSLEQHVATIDADPHGNWATARAFDDALWLFPPATATSWQGPFFCSEQNALTSLDDVTVARAAFGDAWLGERHGLYRYSVGRRCLSTVIRDENILHLLPAGNGMLVGSDRGLRVATTAVRKIDEGAVSDLTVTPKQDVAFYRITPDGKSTNDVRRVKVSDPQAQPATVLADSGWRPHAQPDVLAVRAQGPGSMFMVTSDGAFYYDPQRRTYRDCSQADARAGPVSLTEFRGVENGVRRVLAFADGAPHAITPGDPRWTNLDPEGKTNPRQLAEAGGAALGIGPEGELYRYGSSHLLTGHSSVLRSIPPASNVFTGDLLRSKTGWRMALVSNGVVTEYDSASAEFLDRKGPLPGDLKQVRYTPTGDLLALRENGAVQHLESHKTIFGDGHLPIPVERATAIVRDSEHAITIGGPGGLIATYDWRNGSWTQNTTPWLGEIAALQRRSNGELLITTADNRFYLGDRSPYVLDGRWNEPYRRVAVSDNLLIALARDRVTMTSPASADTDFSIIADVRGVLAASVVAWRKDDRIVFVTPAGKLATYEIPSDSWQVVEADTGPLHAIQVASNGVYALAGKRVVRIDASASVSEEASYEGDVALRVTGGVARTTYVLDGAVLLRPFDDGPTLRYGGGKYVEIDPRAVVQAAKEGEQLVVVDAHANIAQYDPRDGSWRTRYVADENERLVGWLPVRKQLGIIYTRRGNEIRAIQSDGSSTTVAGLPAKLTAPRNRRILDELDIRIVRDDGVTHWTHDIHGTLHPQRGGFDEDEFLSATIAPSGELLAQSRAGVVRFRVVDGRLQTEDAIARGAVLPPMPIPGAVGVFATMKLGDAMVRWVRRSGRGVEPEWEKPSSIPLLGTSCRALAWQCIHDLAVSPRGELLLSTDAGLLVRDARTYAFRKLDPTFAKVKMKRMPVSGEIVLESQRGRFIWRSSRTPPEDLRNEIAETVNLHGWRWRMVGRTLTITKADGRAAASKDIAPGQWKFVDDTVTKIHRTGSDVVFATRGDSWIYRNGRADRFRGALPSDLTRQPTPVLTITALDGKVTLAPFDGREAIVNGRMFFDNATQIAGRENALYTYVPARAVLQRDATEPRRVLRVWPAHSVSPELTLDATDSGVRFKTKNGIALVFDPASRTWREHDVSTSEQNVAAEGVVWHATGGRDARFLPYRGGAVIDGWWSGDRFGWDRIHGVAALTSDVVVFASAAGTWAGRLGPGGWSVAAWRADLHALRAATARHGGTRHGVVVADGAGAEYLVKETPVGVSIERSSASLFERAIARLGFVNGRMEATEWWDKSTSGPAARAELGGFLGNIEESQFDFDAHRSAAPAKGSWWISGCSKSGCFVTRNVLDGGRLALRSMIPTQCALDYLRSDASSITGVCTRGSDLAPTAALRLELPSMRRTILPLAAVANEWRGGQHVLFEAHTLTWRNAGPQLPWSRDPLTTEPSAVPLLVTTPDGVALSFDVFTSLAFDRSSGVIEIGTRGGILRWPWRSSGRQLLAYGVHAGTLDHRAGDVRRLRRCASGDLWALTASGQFVEQVRRTRRDHWPSDCVTAAGFIVNLDGNGIIGPQGPVLRSDNAWSFSNRNLDDIVGFDADDEALWVATRRNGLFKAVRGIVAPAAAGSASERRSRAGPRRSYR